MPPVCGPKRGRVSGVQNTNASVGFLVVQRPRRNVRGWWAVIRALDIDVIDWTRMHTTTADRIDRPLEECEGDQWEPTIPEWSIITGIPVGTIYSWSRHGYLRILNADEHQRVAVDEFLSCAERMTGYATKMRRDPLMLRRFLEQNSVRLRDVNTTARYPRRHMDDDQLVTAAEAAGVLKVQPNTLRRRIHCYKVSSVGRRGREHLYRLTDLLATSNPERRVRSRDKQEQPTRSASGRYFAARNEDHHA